MRRISPSVFACLLPALLLYHPTSATAQSEPDESTAAFIVAPGLIRQIDHKYPASHMVLFRKNCGQDSAGNWNNKLPDGKDNAYSLEISGNGVTATNVKRDDDCSISFDLQTTSTDFGSTVVKVRAGSTQVGAAFIHFADPASGPIPTTTPQVDVLWSPISEHVCNQAFSKAVSSNFYCIAVRIGNNSGYQLQIAGVGFDVPFGRGATPYLVKTPNTSYALTRAVAQNDDSSRSYFVHSIQGLGILMASASPFFHNQRASARYGTFNSIVGGPLQAAFDLIWPDHSVRQSNNLDDQALRDGKLIPNNTQITTVVFLDKNSLSLDYKRACDHLYSSFETPVAGTALAANDQGQGSGHTQTRSLIAHTAKDNQTFLRENHGAAVSGNYNTCINGTSSSGLKEALGHLILVGDTIQYVQRIVVDQTVRSQESPVGSQPNDGVLLAYHTLTITGSNLDKLPASIHVLAGTADLVATKDTTSTADIATYTVPLDAPLQNGTAVSIQTAGNALPRELHGTVNNPPASVGNATLSGNTLTLTGKNLDLLPKSNFFCDDTTLACLGALQPQSTATTATYTLPDGHPAPLILKKQKEIAYQLTSLSITNTTN